MSSVAFSSHLPPAWSLRRPKPWWQIVYDAVGAPARMILFPDAWSEKVHLTSLRAERLSMVLSQMRGRVLDIGAGNNMLVRLYNQTQPEALRHQNVGADVTNWGAGTLLIPSADRLPFPDASFDTVCFMACLNHIPERQAALVEARRLLKPGGRVVITMINHWIGALGHWIWWYSEEKHRHTDDHELPGMDPSMVRDQVREAGLELVLEKGFFYGLNTLYVARPLSR